MNSFSILINLVITFYNDTVTNGDTQITVYVYTIQAFSLGLIYS